MNLFWKLFIGFGIAMALTLVGAIVLSFRLATLAFDQFNIENREVVIERASRALAAGGGDALGRWLAQNPAPAPGVMVMILDESDRDLLGRELPPRYERLLRSRFMRPRAGPPNFRPPQYTASLVGPGGEEFRLLFVRTRVTVLGVLTWPATQLAVLMLAMLAAAVTSFLLARYLSSPIGRLQRATRALAAGALDARVGAPFVRRKDEVGTLARDFDQMAAKIEALVTDKETLLRDVSHELRSPLARIRVALALAQRKAGGGAQGDLARIEQEAERLDELVGQILALARLRSEPVDAQTEVDVNDLVREAVADARFEHPEVEIRFEPGSGASARGNRGQLKSAVENVLRNALLYGGPDPEVEVRIGRDERGVEIAIADRGPGIGDGELQRIFEPFYRADESRDHRHGGYGLGLTITTSVMQRHGGDVSARNRADDGLEVVLTLPAEGARPQRGQAPPEPR